MMKLYCVFLTSQKKIESVKGQNEQIDEILYNSFDIFDLFEVIFELGFRYKVVM